MMVARPGFVLPAGVCRFTPKGEAFNSNARSFEEIAAGATQRNCRLENRRAKGRRDSRPMAGNVCRHKFERARRAGEHFQSNGRGGVRKFSVGPRGRQTDTVRFFPTVGVSPSVTRLRTTSINSRNDLTYSEYSLPLDASWEPDFWGSIRNTYKASKLEAQATLADLENTRLTVQSGLEADYFTLRSLDLQKELLDSTVHAYRDSLALTRVLHKRVAESMTHHEEACGRNQLGQPARESCPNSTVTCCGLSLFVRNCRKALDRRTEP